jgi:molybdenum cofactor synthesis domain-containing protein
MTKTTAYTGEQNQRGTVVAVCISEAKGTPKHTVDSINLLVAHGAEGDAHAGNWHRQVSLLSWDKVEAFRARGAEVADGAFGENLLVKGIDFRALPIGTQLSVGKALMEITQIGKECHSGCAIYQQMGDCIMPREGVFAKVLKEGEVRAGDSMTALLRFRAAILTSSDKGYAGEREDISGAVVREMLVAAGFSVVRHTLLPDEFELLTQEIETVCDEGLADLLVTTGGTGFSPRDIMPEATTKACERMVPGIPEAMRAESLTITKRAMLSRAVAGIRRRTLVINLPGSPKSVRENFSAVLPELTHGLDMLVERDGECAR